MRGVSVHFLPKLWVQCRDCGAEAAPAFRYIRMSIVNTEDFSVWSDKSDSIRVRFNSTETCHKCEGGRFELRVEVDGLLPRHLRHLKKARTCEAKKG